MLQEWFYAEKKILKDITKMIISIIALMILIYLSVILNLLKGKYIPIIVSIAMVPISKRTCSVSIYKQSFLSFNIPQGI